MTTQKNNVEAMLEIIKVREGLRKKTLTISAGNVFVARDGERKFEVIKDIVLEGVMSEDSEIFYSSFTCGDLVVPVTISDFYIQELAAEIDRIYTRLTMESTETLFAFFEYFDLKSEDRKWQNI